jgi:hypothetical protein
MENEVLLVVEKKIALGTIVVGAPHTITLEEFNSPARRRLHLVSDEERRRWWGGKRKFNWYPILSVRRLRTPIKVQYKQGAQVFVKKSSLRIVR